MRILLIKMIWLLTLLTSNLLITYTVPENIESELDSGIVSKKQSEPLITNCQLHTKRVFVRLKLQEAYKKNIPVTAQPVRWADTSWNSKVTRHAETGTTLMLQQLGKSMITQPELGVHSKRSKWFIKRLLTPVAVGDTLFSIGFSSVDSVGLTTVERCISELQVKIPNIRASITRQPQQLQTLGRTVQSTILLVNTQGEILSKMLHAINSLLPVVQVDYAHTQLASSLMSDMSSHSLTFEHHSLVNQTKTSTLITRSCCLATCSSGLLLHCKAQVIRDSLHSQSRIKWGNVGNTARREQGSFTGHEDRTPPNAL